MNMVGEHDFSTIGGQKVVVDGNHVADTLRSVGVNAIVEDITL